MACRFRLPAWCWPPPLWMRCFLAMPIQNSPPRSSSRISSLPLIRTSPACAKMAAIIRWPMTGKSAEPHQSEDILHGAASERDAMHLAPVFCGVADWGQIEQLRSTLAEPPRHSSQWAPLSWPPVVLTLIGATAAAQMPQEAAELAHRFIDSSFRSADSRELDEYGGLPGVTCEYRRAVPRGKWGEIDYANAGIEGYGWGTLSIHLLIRHL